ncbi:hypothetical protein ACFVFI_22910 [Streptomyces sp. NPDC057705]|uniref:hypothetical protein n=1 Tax=Streptomyces sp. NPDC057705 TaxID=3346222 RepID=UPI00369868FF
MKPPLLAAPLLAAALLAAALLAAALLAAALLAAPRLAEPLAEPTLAAKPRTSHRDRQSHRARQDQRRRCPAPSAHLAQGSGPCARRGRGAGREAAGVPAASGGGAVRRDPPRGSLARLPGLGPESGTPGLSGHGRGGTPPLAGR